MKKSKIKKQFTIFRGIGFKKPFNVASQTSLEQTESSLVQYQPTTNITLNNQNRVDPDSLLVQYQPTTNIAFNNQNRVDVFNKYFYFSLSKKFGIQFESTHFFFLCHVLTDFIRLNPQLITLISFHPSQVVAFTRNFAQIEKDIQQQIAQNKKVTNFFNGQKITVQEYLDFLDKQLQPYYQNYRYCLEKYTVQNFVKENYHTLYLNAMWFFDVTAIAELGDNIQKDSGPSAFFFEAATKTVVHYKLFRSKKEIQNYGSIFKKSDCIIDSNSISTELQIALKKHNIPGPIYLHSDSDNKNKSPDYLLSAFQHGITPSLNKTFYGPPDSLHKNQVIETFNFHIKQKLVKILINLGYTLGKLESIPFFEKQDLFAKAIDLYHNTEHTTLSTKVLSHKSYIPITPKESFEHHVFIEHIFARYCQIKSSSGCLPSNVREIANLDLTNTLDTRHFESYVAKFIFADHFQKNSFHVLYDLLELKNGNLRESTYSYFQNVVHTFFSYAVANSSNKRLNQFFNPLSPNQPIGVKGPGRARVSSHEFSSVMKTKEDFSKCPSTFNTIIINVAMNLYFMYASLQQENDQLNATALVFKKTDQQTQEIKSYIDDTIKLEIRQLHTTIDDLRLKLESFYQKDKIREELKAKRKVRKQRDLTPAINLGHFMKALNIIKKEQNNTKNISKMFNGARNRLALFILYFSGIRVGMLKQITISDLISIFEDRQEIGISISKTRTQKKQQIFSIGETVRKTFIYGDNNLWNDFKLVVETFDSWAKNNDIAPEDCYNKSFFAKYTDLSQPCSREYINKKINEIIRNAGSAMGISKKHILTFSTHSFRIQFITNFIYRFGIRSTQLHMGHQNINNTARYDRSTFPVKQLNNLTDCLCYYKSKFKVHPDVQKYGVSQLQAFANVVADQNNIPQVTSNQDPEFLRLINGYQPQNSPGLNYCSDQFSSIEQECLEIETLFQKKVNKLDIDPTKVVKARKHLIHSANAKKSPKKAVKV